MSDLASVSTPGAALAPYIYLDYNATTPVDARVASAIRGAVEGELAAPFANPSSLYRVAKPAKALLADARAAVAALLGASSPDEILFESGGSESINHVFKGLAIEAWASAAQAAAHASSAAAGSSSSPAPAPASGGAASGSTPSAAKPHIVVSAIEHVAVLECVAWLERKGFADATRVPCGVDGIVAAADVAAAVIPGRTLLVSVMLANNETGAVQPIRGIGDAVRRHIRDANAAAIAAGAAAPPFPRPYVHTDASQCVGKLPFSVGSHPASVPAPAASAGSGDEANVGSGLGVDFVTVAGHKLYCPKGIGATYIRSRAASLAAAAANPLVPEPALALPVFMHGAGQEGGRRAGTENLVLSAALGAAAATFTAPAEAGAASAAVSGSKYATAGEAEAAHCAELRDRLAHRLVDICSSDAALCAAGMPVIHGPLRQHIAAARSAKSAGSTADHPLAASSSSSAAGGGYTSLPNTLSIAFPGCFAAEMVGLLSGSVAVSAGAACHATAPGDPRAAHVSHVLAAMAVPRSLALATLRLSVGRWSTAAEMDAAADAIAAAARKAVTTTAGAAMRELQRKDEESALAAAPRAAAAGGAGAATSAIQRKAAPPAAAVITLPPTRCRFLEDTHLFALEHASIAAVLSTAASAKGEAVPQLPAALPSTSATAASAVEVAHVPIGPAVAVPPGASIGDTAVLLLSETVAHPQGGGQPSDRGVVQFNVASTIGGGSGSGGGGVRQSVAFVFHAARKADRQLARDGLAAALRAHSASRPAEDSADNGAAAADAEALMCRMWSNTAVAHGDAAAAASSAPADTDRILHYGRFYSVQNTSGAAASWAAALADALPPNCAISDIAGASSSEGGGSTGIVVPVAAAGSPEPVKLLLTPMAAADVLAHSAVLLGAACSVHICGPHRRMAARLHSAGHLLDLAVRRVLGRWVEADVAARAALAAASPAPAAPAPTPATATATVEAAAAVNGSGSGAGAGTPAPAVGAPSEGASPKGKPGKGGKGGTSKPAAGGAGGPAAMPAALQQLVPGKGYHFADGPFVEYQGTVALPLQLDSTASTPQLAASPTAAADAATSRFAAEVAEACSQLLAEDAPTHMRVLRSDDAAGLASAGLAPADVAHLPPGTPVRIVSVGGAGNTCPCGGTHVKRAGEIGRGIAVTKVVSKKGVTKVSYALLD